MRETRSSYRISRRALLALAAPLARAVAAVPASPIADPSRLEHIFALPSSLPAWASWLADLEKRIPEVMKKHSVPGASVALIRDAKVYWQRGFGVRDAETRQPVDTGTVFEAASMSKSVFAYVVMKLAEKGVIDLDTPLTKYTPVRYAPGDPLLDRITARHVLMHSTGFTNWRTKEIPLRVDFPPGSKFGYSGEGYSYLQSVITHLTGHEDKSKCGNYEVGVRFCATDIADYMKVRILRPFAMDSSGYLWNEQGGNEQGGNEQIAKNLARPHGEHGEPLSPGKTSAVDASRYGAAGGLKTTPTDYAKFLIEVMQPKPMDEYHLSRRSRDEMIRRHIDVGPGQGPFSVSWGLGFRVIRIGDQELIGHGGSNPGFQCFSEISVARKCGFVLMTNADCGVELLKSLAPTVLG